jgi:hypothetical protein
MIDFGNIESKLNLNAAYRQAFLSDPVAALAREGISLSQEMGDRLRDQVKAASVRGGVKFRWGLIVGPCV